MGHAHTALSIVSYVHLFNPDKLLCIMTTDGQGPKNDGKRGASSALSGRIVPDSLLFPSLLPNSLTYFSADVVQKEALLRKVTSLITTSMNVSWLYVLIKGVNKSASKRGDRHAAGSHDSTKKVWHKHRNPKLTSSSC